MRLDKLTYNKPHNITYTDMCIWIDNNMYKDDCDDAKLYEYLYHIINMFARKNSYFSNAHYYDDFALSSASRLFMRIKDLRLTKIKSILNYIKTVIYPYKVDFEKDNYVNNTEDSAIIYTEESALGTNLLEEIDFFDKIEFNYTLQNISNLIHSYLLKIPQKLNSSEWSNIYLSCMLTLLNEFTISGNNKLSKSNISDKELHNLYLTAYNEEPVVYHLDKSYGAYIKVLVNELKNVISKNLSIEQHSQISAESALKSIIIASMELEE